MTAATADFTDLVQHALKAAKAQAPRAVDDLRRCASQAADAVARVTGGVGTLELVPINQGENAKTTYQLQLRKVNSEAPPSDLGVYNATAAGYPIERWYSRAAWEEHPEQPVKTFGNSFELEGHFKWLVSTPESRLVVLVSFLQQQASETERRS